MTTVRDWFDVTTALLWLVLAVIGIVLRVRRLVRLHRIHLIEPVNGLDAEYLESVRRSTYLRLAVKIVFLLGALITVFHIDLLWPFWRGGIVLVLVLMIAETRGVDTIRNRLARVEELSP